MFLVGFGLIWQFWR